MYPQLFSVCKKTCHNDLFKLASDDYKKLIEIDIFKALNTYVLEKNFNDFNLLKGLLFFLFVLKLVL